jgi:Protein of unknown function (DUF2795)
VAEKATVDEVMTYLPDVDYPADKDTLLAVAERHGAPPEVLKAIRAIPPVDYRSRAEVIQSVRTDTAPERDPSKVAEQARLNSRSRIAEPLRDPPHERVKGERRRAP